MCVEKIWNSLQTLWSQLVGNEEPDEELEADRRQRDLLRWIAQTVRDEGWTLNTLPERLEVPTSVTDMRGEALQEKCTRWARLLCLMKVRPDALAVQLALGLRTDRLRPRSIAGAVQTVAPHLKDANFDGEPDEKYIELELGHCEKDTYELKIALAYAAGRYDADFASNIAGDAMNMQPEKYEAHRCLGAIAEMHDRFDVALQHFETAMNKGCTDCRASAARAANQAGQPEKALQLADDAPLQRNPQLRLETARALRILGRSEKALEEFESVNMSALQNRREAEAEMAEVQLSLGRTREAIRTARGGVREGLPRAMRVTGQAHFQEGDYRQACDVLHSLLEEQPGDAEAWYLLAASELMRGMNEEAITHAETAMRLRANDERARSIRAQALTQAERYTDALEMLAEEPGLLSPPFVARCFIGTGMVEEAAGYISTWIERQPDEPLAWLYFGYLSILMGQYDDALRYYAEAWRRAPSNDFARDQYQQLQAAVEADMLPERPAI